MLETPGSPPKSMAASGAGPMIGDVAPHTDGGIVVTTDLDPAGQPFLDDHRIEGTPVLPGVMGMEAFAEASRLLAPGWDVAAIENVEFLAPFKWYRDQPRRLEVHVSAVPDDDSLVATCRLDGRRTLPGQPEQVTTHFTGRVILRRTAGELGTAPPPPPPDGPVLPQDAIYKVYFHGPAYQVLARAWRDGATTIGELTGDLPPSHGGGSLVAAPRLVELCFQTAGVAQLAVDGTLGLPSKVRRLEVVSGADETTACWVRTTTRESGAVEAVVVDGDGRVLVRLSGYETVALPGAAGPDLLAPFATALR
jgi:Polyketide synthase dehydratase